MNIGSLDNYNNNILIATNNMDFGINSINNTLLPDMPKSDGVPTELVINNTNNDNNIINKEDTKYVDYHDTKYILPFIIGGSIGLLVYFIK
jgi:hypothetical protein